jgi:hypothetical protein
MSGAVVLSLDESFCVGWHPLVASPAPPVTYVTQMAQFHPVNTGITSPVSSHSGWAHESGLPRASLGNDETHGAQPEPGTASAASE